MTGMRARRGPGPALGRCRSEPGCISISKSRVCVERRPSRRRPRPTGPASCRSTPQRSRCCAPTPSLSSRSLSTSRGPRAAPRLHRPGGAVLRPPVSAPCFPDPVAKAALPTFSLHGLRHTHASCCCRPACRPRSVQERLGHSSIRITMDIYSHVTPGHGRRRRPGLRQAGRLGRRDERLTSTATRPAPGQEPIWLTRRSPTTGGLPFL